MNEIPKEKRLDLLNKVITSALQNMKKDEFENLRANFNKYNLGALLWAKELYPNASLILSLLQGPYMFIKKFNYIWPDINLKFF